MGADNYELFGNYFALVQNIDIAMQVPLDGENHLYHSVPSSIDSSTDTLILASYLHLTPTPFLLLYDHPHEAHDYQSNLLLTGRDFRVEQDLTKLKKVDAYRCKAKPLHKVDS